MRVLIVEARFYEELLDELEKGAVAALEAAGVEYDIVHVPGALEVPGAIAMAEQASLADAMAGDMLGEDIGEPLYDAYVALGVVIRGETSHYDIVAGESARGLMDLSLEGVCIGNGILTVENAHQAWARARVSEKNKGAGAAEAALAMVRLKQQFIARGRA